MTELDTVEKFEEKVLTDIDYIGVLDYLKHNSGVPYSKPEAAGITAAEKKDFLEIKRKGQAVVKEMKKMVAICKERFGLDKCEPMPWLDGSNTKTRKYLWAQMKYAQFASSPVSISIFVELSDETIGNIIKQELKDTYIMFKIDLDRCIKTRKGLVYVEELI